MARGGGTINFFGGGRDLHLNPPCQVAVPCAQDAITFEVGRIKEELNLSPVA